MKNQKKPRYGVFRSEHMGKNADSPHAYHPRLMPHKKYGIRDLAVYVANDLKMDQDQTERVIQASMERLVDLIIQGYSIDLPPLGRFKLKLKATKPAAHAELCTPDKVSFDHVDFKVDKPLQEGAKLLEFEPDNIKHTRANQDERVIKIMQLFDHHRWIDMDMIRKAIDSTNMVAGKDVSFLKTQKRILEEKRSGKRLFCKIC